MAITVNMIEELAQWCSRSDTLADVRSQVRREYFGYDEPGEVKYMPGTEEVTSRERRFLGWFAFSFRLPDGKHPAEMAAAAMLKGRRVLILPDLSASKNFFWLLKIKFFP